MTGDEFKKWRKKLGFRTRADAAHHFGVKEETIKSWELERRKVPQYAIRMIRQTLDYQVAVNKL